MSAPIRTFIAVEVPDRIKSALGDLTGGLRGEGLSEVRWTRPQGIHLTLKFLGNIDPSRTANIMDGLKTGVQETAPFQLGLGSLGVFPNIAKPRVIWMGLAGELEKLRLLQEAVEEQTLALGFSRDKRGFTPHLTLGRVRNSLSTSKREMLSQATRTTSFASSLSWKVSEANLIHSTLAPEGAIYRKLGTVQFNGNQPERP